MEGIKGLFESITSIDNDPEKGPLVRWRAHANLLFSNWLNYFVYQTTPYDIMTIGEEE